MLQRATASRLSCWERNLRGHGKRAQGTRQRHVLIALTESLYRALRTVTSLPPGCASTDKRTENISFIGDDRSTSLAGIYFVDWSQVPCGKLGRDTDGYHLEDWFIWTELPMYIVKTRSSNTLNRCPE